MLTGLCVHVPRCDVLIREDADLFGQSLLHDGTHIPVGPPEDVSLLFPTRKESGINMLLCGVPISSVRMGLYWESCGAIRVLEALQCFPS